MSSGCGVVVFMLGWLGWISGVGANGLEPLPYRARLDDSQRTGVVYVPATYDGGEPLPLIVALREGPANAEAANLAILPALAAAAESNGCLVVCPWGRGRDLATGVGSHDILQVVEEVCRSYRVNARQVALLGYGLGGVAAWRLACFYPDRWSAVAIVESGENPSAPAPRDLLDRMLCGTEPDLFDYAVNLMHVPVRFHLAAGRAGPLNWKAAAEALRQLAYEVEVVEQEIPDSPRPGAVEEDLCRWLVRHARSICPSEIRLRTPCASFGRAYWAEIVQFENPAAPAEIRARVSGTGGMIVHCLNTKQFALDLGAGQYPAGHFFVDVIINQYANPVMCPTARRYVIGPAGQDPWLWVEVTNAPAGPIKEAGLEGPMGRAFSEEFALVVGADESDSALTAAARKAVEDFSRAWRGRYGSDPLVLEDTRVTEDILWRKHLVLVGTPSTNSPLAGAASAMPLWKSGDGIFLGSRRFDAPDVGFGVVYPNPSGSRRLLLVLDATSARALDRIFEVGAFQRDYFVFRVRPDGATETLAEGRFDSNWTLAETD